MTSGIANIILCYYPKISRHQAGQADEGGQGGEGAGAIIIIKYNNKNINKNTNNNNKVLELCEEFVPGEVPEYFFDKNPENFPAILDMYRQGPHVIGLLIGRMI